ncbi:glycosyltransferase, partial [Candidatus Uhrbacteria bacterium]|nr:glycosyltransferase [Candidatus Uhrbacteria bacterium]
MEERGVLPNMKVKMVPGCSKNPVNGIAQVINHYHKYLPKFGIELTDGDSYDLLATHAGSLGAYCDVAHCHGLYWTADYESRPWEYKTNADVIASLRNAKVITVPSEWVARSIRRDMRRRPMVVPHGIECEQWQTDAVRGSFVLWNKNRAGDVCSVEPLEALARLAPDTQFVSTFGAGDNIKTTGTLKFEDMRRIILRAGIYLATTQETFGIGTLEAMASGVPVLGYDHGGTAELVEHGVTGYLAQNGNVEDLLEGLRFCQKHNAILGRNARQRAKLWTWEHACELVAKAYERAMKPEPPTVAIVIPCYNYAHVVERALVSAMAQDYDLVTDIVVVDDGSQDDPLSVVEPYMRQDKRVRMIKQDNGGVASARNTGIASTD